MSSGYSRSWLLTITSPVMRLNSIWKVSSNRYGRQNIRLTALITSVAGHDEQVVAADLRHADIAGKLCLYPHVGISTHNCRYVGETVASSRLFQEKSDQPERAEATDNHWLVTRRQRGQPRGFTAAMSVFPAGTALVSVAVYSRRYNRAHDRSWDTAGLIFEAFVALVPVVISRSFMLVIIYTQSGTGDMIIHRNQNLPDRNPYRTGGYIAIRSATNIDIQILM